MGVNNTEEVTMHSMKKAVAELEIPNVPKYESLEKQHLSLGLIMPLRRKRYHMNQG